MNKVAQHGIVVGQEMKLRLCALLTLSLVAAPGCVASQITSLRSPWDGHPIKTVTGSYSCPAIPHIAPGLVTDGFYKLDDPTHSIIDPIRMEAYRRSSDAVKSAGLTIVRAADDYRTSGVLQAAQCAVERMNTLARDGALAGSMSSNQAYYVQGWVVGAIAIAYLKVRDSGTSTPEENASIRRWLLNVAEQTKRYYDVHRTAGHGDGLNNHLYWAGVEVAAIGIAANARSDFEWGIKVYEDGINQIKPDGTLPLEMARGSKALHYHLYALAPLVLLAEFGESNGLDLYAHGNGSLHRLVNLCISGLQDPTPFEKATGVKQEVPGRPSGDQIGWAPPYLQRFRNPVLMQMVAHAPNLSVYYLGGLPPIK
ncbi:alginate lyase family protein [Granulicella sp. S190]|uniref:alginate lyase family protein n=1 Tax=Granulicella sp. S190 TaxID=1747226 RepID=UPI0020B1586F|nr:alginate lyase family protein [Granulicella sp. S190]